MSFPIGADSAAFRNDGAPHDFIQLAIPNSAPFRRKAIELYEKGLSLREVAAELNLSKTKVRKTLLQVGVQLREWTLDPKSSNWRIRGKQARKPPYGFRYFEGVLTQDQREYPVLREILRRWKAGESLCSIAATLNEKGIPSAYKKAWSDNAVKYIIQSAKDGRLVERDGKYELKVFSPGSFPKSQFQSK